MGAFSKEKKSTTSTNKVSGAFSVSLTPEFSSAKNAEYDRKYKAEVAKKVKDAIDEYNAKLKERADSNFISKAFSGVKDFLGYDTNLPAIDNAPREYNIARDAQLAQTAYDKEWLGRAQNFTQENIVPSVKNFGKNIAEINYGISPFATPEQRNASISAGKGAFKNAAQLVSGATKVIAKVVTGQYGLDAQRKLFGNEFVDRTTPDYVKKVGGFIDESGILNYKPVYANEYEKTGGDIAEIGSWFIPISRIGKVGKIEEAISKIPKVKAFLGATPSVVKSGGKLFYEVGRDAVDIASLDILRGKSWDEIETDMKVGAVGGATLRLGADGLSKFLSQSKSDSIISTVEKSIGKLSKEEESIVKSSIDEGNSIDTVVNKINDSRESKSTELSPEVKSTPEDPLLQEVRSGKYANAEEFVNSKATVWRAGREYHPSRVNPDDGVSFSYDKNVAQKFADMAQVSGGNAVPRPFYIKPEAKILDMKDIPKEMWNSEYDMVAYATKNGYDAIKIDQLGQYKEAELRVVNPDVIVDRHQLIDLYNKAQEKRIDTSLTEQPKPDVTPKKESGYAKSLEEKAVEKKMASEFQDLAEYTPAVRKEQAQMTTKLINEDIEKVNSILDGKAELPSGMRGSSLALAVEQHAIANNDVKLLQKLAKSKIATRISEAGSELSMLAGRNANSPVRIIRNIIKARKENIVKRLKGKKISEARKVTKESIKKAIKKEAPTKETWSNFIKEIKC